MRVYDNLDDIDIHEIGKPLAIALGNFDGVHRGHQQLLTRLKGFAQARDLETVVFTFYPHPLALLKPDYNPKLILSVEDKLEMLAELGVETVILAPFDWQLAKMTAQEFVTNVLVDKLQVEGVFVGYNYTFGTGGAGNPETLSALANHHGFHLDVTDPVEVDGRVVSSSLIRKCIGNGWIRQAAQLLGYQPFLRGQVVHGEHRGRTIGFPTANLELRSERIYPAPGVYAVVVEDQQQRYVGVANLGVKPTFSASNLPNLEVHLLEFEDDLYGRELKVEFIEKIRDEQKFVSIQALVTQIQNDVRATRNIVQRLNSGFSHNLADI